MKKSWRNNKVALINTYALTGKQFSMLLLFIVIITGCSQHKDDIESHDQYVCPMHPTVVRDKPGVCPICGMELVRKTKPAEKATSETADLNQLVKPVNDVVVSKIRSVSPVEKKISIESQAKGVIVHDTRQVATIAARYSGRIEKLYIKSNLQEVHKGQKMMEIYSPELLTAQRELLFLLDKDPDNATLINSSKQKLILLGLSEAHVNTLISSKKESYSFVIFSPVDGYIMEHAEGAGMLQDAADPLQVREGMYVKAGESVFSVVSHSELWAEFDLYQQDLHAVKVNDPVSIMVDSDTEATMQSRVSSIQPFIKDGESFTKVRVYLSNQHHHYHAGQFVTAKFAAEKKGIWIPVASVVDLGTEKVVFEKRDGVYHSKQITTGDQSNEWIEVLNGLQLTDSIAYNAQFMVDSESFIPTNQN